MEIDNVPTMIVALYDGLTEAEGALNDLQTAGVLYPHIHMGTHSNDEVNPAMLTAPLPADGRFWSLAVEFEPSKREQIVDVLQKYNPFTLGFQKAAREHDEVAQGRVAWGHYVFATPAATDAVGDAAGTAGTTGVISSGAFADNTKTERPTTAS